HELVVTQRFHASAQLLRHAVELVRALLGDALHELASFRRRGLVLAPLDALALGVDDVLHLLAQLVDCGVEVVAAELALARLTQLLEELLQALHVRRAPSQQALQRLLRWGSPNMQGLEQLLKQLREARERELGRYNLDSTVDQLRQEVQDVIDTEREGIERRQNEAATPEARKLMERIAKQRTDQLDRMPEELGGRVKALRDYEFV